MTKEDFLKNDSSYYGETVDDMDQVMYRNFNGEELKEYVEHHIQEQVKAGVTSEGDCTHFGTTISHGPDDDECVKCGLTWSV